MALKPAPILVRCRAPAGERPLAARARADLRRFVRALGEGGRQGGPGTLELSLWLCTDITIRRLNRLHRGVDAATDVLSFPAAPRPGPVRPLGDLVVSLPTARRRARALGVPVEAELRRYLAHGLLHLLGHDHQTRGEARRMARAEGVLLGGRGLVG